MGATCSADPDGPAPGERSGGSELEAAIERLAGRKGRWAALPLAERLGLLSEMRDLMMAADHRAWAADSLTAMGLDPDKAGPLLAIEMLLNTRIMTRDLEGLMESLAGIMRDGAPPQGEPLDSQRVKVFPRSRADAAGPQREWQVELWLAEAARQGKFYARRNHLGGVALGRVSAVLGAGNQGFLTMCDVLYTMFVDGAVVALKHNPVREYNHKWVEYLFGPLIREGYLHSFIGGAAEGKALVQHRLVQHVHITGGTATHDAIVWGCGEEQAANKAASCPVLQKPITSELGCITPWLIAPAVFSEAELDHHARHLATAFLQNNSCNCNAPKLLVLSDNWAQKQQFLDKLTQVISQRPTAVPYYPGTAARYRRFQQEHPTSRQIESLVPTGPAHPKFGPNLPALLIQIDYDQASGPLGSPGHPYALQNEAFAPVLAVVSLPGDFLSTAPEFVNGSVLGSLSASLVAHPSCPAEQVEAAVAELKYGTVALNTWTGSCFQFECGSWGAFPGEDLAAVQSGIGAVRNYLLYEGVQKCVVRSPFMCPSHIGCSAPPSVEQAERLVAVMTGACGDTTVHNQDNPYRRGNMLPIKAEAQHSQLKLLSGDIPGDLHGMFVRNGTNQRFEPSGKQHMYDGDAMIHCVRFKGEDPAQLKYSCTWLRSPRFVANEAAGRELFASFGDLTLGGIPVARKLGLQALRMRAGALPLLADNRKMHTATSTWYAEGRMYAVMELCPPFQIKIDPNTGVVQSGEFDDLDGQVDRFSAHYKTDQPAGQTHYIGSGMFSPVCTYGVVDHASFKVHQMPVKLGSPPPAFLHDCFLTENYFILVDHSLRINQAGLTQGKLYDFDQRFPVRFGLIPRSCADPSAVRWFDTGRTGFHWHCVNGWETEDGKLVLYMPLFDEYPSSVPIHTPDEPPSKLHKFVLDLESGQVSGGLVPAAADLLTERCEVNREFAGKPGARWAYLMRRGEDEMYSGFVKFDLQTESIVSDVDFGNKRLGGEALFVPKREAAAEDDGYLLDFIFDGNGAGQDGIGTSELCIWDAAALSSEPVARIEMPNRIPFGVHASWLSEAELKAQAEWF